jgi:hypothetical protein
MVMLLIVVTGVRGPVPTSEPEPYRGLPPLYWETQDEIRARRERVERGMAAQRMKDTNVNGALAATL